MKNFKLLLSFAVATALMGCSSMDVEESEALAGNVPADFDVNEYIALHPELLRVQIQEYVASYNEKAKSAAAAAGEVYSAAFKDSVIADSLSFLDSVNQIRAIARDYAGYNREADSIAWETSLLPTTIDSIITETKYDTLAVGAKSKADAEAPFVKTFVCPKASQGSITYAEDGKTIVTVVGYAQRDSTCSETDAKTGKKCIAYQYTCVGDPTTYDSTDYEFNTKASTPKMAGLITRESQDSVGVKPVEQPGFIEPNQLKAARKFNFVDSRDDLAKLKAIEIDYFAISYQYAVFGKEHGWAYRRCKPEDNLGRYLYEPVVDPETGLTVDKATAEYPIAKLYCDENGQARELN
jgi:hypothetical protein